MEQDNQEIIDKIEGIIENKYGKLEGQLRNIKRNLEFFALGVLIIGLLVGYGVALSKAIYVMFGFGFLLFAYYVYCDRKSNPKN